MGVVTLQIALFGIVGSDTRGDALTFQHFASWVMRSTVVEGSPFPPATAYDERGARAGLISGNHEATLIFKADCTCDSEQVRSWNEAARKRGETVTVIVAAPPRELARIKKENGINAPLRSMRLDEMLRLGIGSQNLPTAVHILPDNTILSVQWR